MLQAQHLTANETDGAKFRYDDFHKSVVRQNLPPFEEFNFFNLQHDQFLSPYLRRNNKYQDILKVRIFIFTMSHGQSTVERGFNISKYQLVQNLREVSTRGQVSL